MNPCVWRTWRHAMHSYGVRWPTPIRLVISAIHFVDRSITTHYTRPCRRCTLSQAIWCPWTYPEAVPASGALLATNDARTCPGLVEGVVSQLFKLTCKADYIDLRKRGPVGLIRISRFPDGRARTDHCATKRAALGSRRRCHQRIVVG